MSLFFKLLDLLTMANHDDDWCKDHCGFYFHSDWPWLGSFELLVKFLIFCIGVPILFIALLFWFIPGLIIYFN